jgi:tetratricopeptide (TPR) repeat protein
VKIKSRLAPWAEWGKERLFSWGEKAGNIWATYWLLIGGSFLILASVVIKWVEFPFSRNLSGLRLPLLGQVGPLPHLSLFSFGLLGLGALGLGIVFRRRFGPALVLAAMLLLTLWVMVPCHIAFQQPALLKRLIDEDVEAPQVKMFTKEYLPQNMGPIEDIPKRPDLYTAWGRLNAGLSFLRIGWYCFGIGSLVVAIYAIGRLTENKAIMVTALICLPVASVGVVLTVPLIAQHYFSAASKAEAEGRNEEAITGYRRAIRLDGWHAQDIALYATIGQLQKLAGLAPGSPERHISRAAEFAQASEYEQAIFELEQAATAPGALGEAARQEAARTRVDLGLAIYRAGGFGGAVSNWEEALAEDPSLLFALSYLARGYYDLASYQTAIDVAVRLAKIVADHDQSLANAYSVAGDSYAKLGRDDDARRYYNLSMTADPILNHWALTGLAGE